jgi:4-amino-4-deoxy-L-arabinose transferase-like glycosyltransferase
MGSTSRWARRAVWLIALATVLRALVWVVALPPWQGPDEGVHYSYVERIAVVHSIPPLSQHKGFDRFSDAVSQSTASTDYIGLLTREQLRFLRRDMTAFPSEPNGLSGVSKGKLLTGSYPPGYYLLGAVAYELPGLHNATSRLYAIRVVSALLGGLAALLIFRLLLVAGVPELLSVLGTAAFVQLPMFSQSSAIVNPDIMLLVTLAGLTGSLLRARVDMTRRRLLFVLLWGVLAALSKPIGGPAALLLVVALLGLRPTGSSWWRRLAVAAGLLASLIAAYVAEAVASNFSLRDGYPTLSLVRYAISYLWQFYLPRLWFMASGPYKGHGYLPAWWVWVETTTGYFGWLSVPMSQWWYRLAFWTLAVAVVIAIVGFVRYRGRDLHAAGALLVAALAYVLLLHLSEVLLVINNQGTLLQGRYLLPIVPLFEAALLLGLARLGRVGIATAAVLVGVTFLLSVQGLTDVLVFYG